MTRKKKKQSDLKKQEIMYKLDEIKSKLELHIEKINKKKDDDYLKWANEFEAKYKEDPYTALRDYYLDKLGAKNMIGFFNTDQLNTENTIKNLMEVERIFHANLKE